MKEDFVKTKESNLGLFFEEVKTIVRTTKRIVKVSKESNVKRDTLYKKVKSVYRIVD